MAQKIRELAEEYDNIVVITGAAHVSNLENKLEGLSINNKSIATKLKNRFKQCQ